MLSHVINEALHQWHHWPGSKLCKLWPTIIQEENQVATCFGPNYVSHTISDPNHQHHSCNWGHGQTTRHQHSRQTTGVSKVLQFTKLPNGNLQSHLRKAANELRKDRDIVILPVNKGNVTVVMDRKEYTEKLECMLEDGMYSKLRKDPTSSIESRVTQALKRRIHKEETTDYGSTPTVWPLIGWYHVYIPQRLRNSLCNFPVRGLRILVSSLARLYVAEPTAKTMGLSGMPSSLILGKTTKWSALLLLVSLQKSH